MRLLSPVKSHKAWYVLNMLSLFTVRSLNVNNCLCLIKPVRLALLTYCFRCSYHQVVQRLQISTLSGAKVLVV